MRFTQLWCWYQMKLSECTINQWFVKLCTIPNSICILSRSLPWLYSSVSGSADLRKTLPVTREVLHLNSRTVKKSLRKRAWVWVCSYRLCLLIQPCSETPQEKPLATTRGGLTPWSTSAGANPWAANADPSKSSPAALWRRSPRSRRKASVWSEGRAARRMFGRGTTQRAPGSIAWPISAGTPHLTSAMEASRGRIRINPTNPCSNSYEASLLKTPSSSEIKRGENGQKCLVSKHV